MAVKDMPGYSGSLTEVMLADDSVIPLSNPQVVLDRLTSDGDWTTLLVQDTVGYEVIRAKNFRGDLVIDRGLSGTTPKKFPVGSCVSFVMTLDLLKEFICTTDCCEDGTDITFGQSTEAPLVTTVSVLPKEIVGGASQVLGRPLGYMLLNGKSIPYYAEE